MHNMDHLYCRFCAEPKSSEKLFNLQLDEQKHDEVSLKLAFLNAVYVDVSSGDALPKTVCFVCYDSLNRAYDFLEGVKRAQDVLSNLCIPTDANKCELSDDDRVSNDDFPISTNNPDDELEDETATKTYDSDGISIEVKREPEEEIESSNQAIDVQDILDAALKVPFTPEVTIYAKEMTDMNKRSIKSWKYYPWLCSYCSIGFLSIELLRSHAKVVHGKCSAFLCIDCKVSRKYDFLPFIKHVGKHRKNLRNCCYYCDKQFNDPDYLTLHIKEHIQKPQIPCKLCGEIFNDEALKTHLQDITPIKPKRKPRRKPGTPLTTEDLTCDVCKKIYKNPNSLRDHMKLHIIGRKRDYTCDRCGKTFYNKGTLTSHIMSHDKIRPHICRICNKSFLFPNMLRRHVEVHSGIKPFSCEQCGRCFRLLYQLNAHKIVHTDSMPHVCQYCNKAFRFKQILKNHERQHTGAKPYSCKHCCMEFTNWSNYNKHMKRRHGTDTSKKKITPEGVFPVNPETGQIIRVQDPVGTAEWKSKIMVPAKRGKKKKIIKQEDIS